VKASPSLTQLQLDYQEAARKKQTETRLEADKTNEILVNSEQEQGMTRLAESIVSGNGQAAANYKDARADYLSYRAGIYEARYEDTPAESDVGRLTQEYQTLNPKSEEFTDENGDVDWDAYEKRKAALLKKLPAATQAAVRNNDKFKDANLNKVEKEFQKARAVVDKFYDTPKYKGLSLQEGEELDDLVENGVNRVQTLNIQKLGQPLGTAAALVIAAKEQGVNPKILRFALMFRKQSTKKAFMLDTRDNLLLDNQLILSRYYPDLLEQQLSRAEEAQLPNEVLNQLIGAR